ncbi:MAG: hypothetical protein HY236_08880 [Acidobacteria bacterium]|nr:hypothetical protein [Acidobacteriota bacterium]
MNPFLALEQYLREVKRRAQMTVASRGLAVAGAAALVLTLLCVLFTNRFAFASWSVIFGRLALFGALAAIVAAVLVRPLLAMRRPGGSSPWVRRLERRFPAFEQRIQTWVDQNKAGQDKPDQKHDRANPILALLAEDTLKLAAEAPPTEVASSGPIWTFAGLGLAAIAVIIWLGVAGPGYLGYGTARLWAGWLRPSVSNLYQIVVEPGSVTIRRKADLLISARTIGFYSPTARLFAKFASGAKWEEAPMQRRLDDSGFEFVFAGVEESLRYYIAAGGVKSPEYKVRVVEMPHVKKLRLTYHYPSWTGLAVNTEEPGGDVRAVASTEVEVEVETDRPLPAGVLRLDGKVNIPLSNTQSGESTWSHGRLTVEKDGQYYVAALYNGEMVRLTDDFFIEAIPDREPTVRLSRPGRDYRATSIEEVTAQLEAEDDFGLKGFELRYSINGGPEKTVPLVPGGRKQGAASHTFPLENFSLVPGDVVSYYAVARDAKVESKTDMYFIEVQPFEREYRQAQQTGGGGGEGGDDESAQISRRQKEIVAATWNLARERSLDRLKAAEHAKTLSGLQSKLRDQARTLAERMKRRELVTASDDFKAFGDNMEKAAEAMGPASDKLGQQKWTDALPPEQKALQHLLRAEAIFRDIQVAFGNMGGGGGNMGRDLAEMFDLELDTAKNQYETGRQASAQERDRELDEALEKLRQLARRQEQLAEQQRRQQLPTFDQRWQQEMLRREAEDLARRLQQMQQQQQAGQSGQQGGQSASNLRRALDRLQQAARDMQAASSGSPQQAQSGGGAEAQRRAQERMREAEDLLSGERRQRASDEMEDLEKRANDMAERQQAMANKLQEAMRQALETQRANPGASDPITGRPLVAQGLSREQVQAMAREKEQMLSQLDSMESRMAETARRLAPTQPNASRRLRETVSNMREADLGPRLRWGADMLKRGMGLYAAQREEAVTQGFNQLRDGLKETRRLAQAEQQGGDQNLERALSRVEQLRRQLEQAQAAQRARQQGGGQQGQQPGEQQGGQPGGESQQAAPGAQRGGGNDARAGRDYSNRGDWQPTIPGRVPPIPIDPARVYREGQGELSQIERALRNDPALARDLEELRREIGRVGILPTGPGGNPLLLDREAQKLLLEAEQLELLLRRKLDEKQGAQVRAGAQQPVPEEYRKAVADYFRRLSKEK